MNRLGFLQSKIKKVLRQINESKLVEVVGVYSHIYDNKSKADILSQKAVFDRCTKLLKGNVVTHLAATAGIDFVTDYKMARVGLGIYGYPKDKAVKIALDVIVNFHGVVLTEVNLVCFDDETYDLYINELKRQERLNKIKGSLLGGAIGDALGYPVEFNSYFQIQ
jgi:alanine racemase